MCRSSVPSAYSINYKRTKEKVAHRSYHRGLVMNRACRSWHPVHAGAAGSGPRSAPPSLHPSPLGPRPPLTRGDPAQHPEHPKHKHLMDFSETVRGKEIGEQQRTSNCAREAAHPLARARTQVGRFERPRHRRIPLALETFRILRVPELARWLGRGWRASGVLALRVGRRWRSVPLQTKPCWFTPLPPRRVGCLSWTPQKNTTSRRPPPPCLCGCE